MSNVLSSRGRVNNKSNRYQSSHASIIPTVTSPKVLSPINTKKRLSSKRQTLQTLNFPPSDALELPKPGRGSANFMPLVGMSTRKALNAT